jgi:putative ABC transport system substrate-binding protein
VGGLRRVAVLVNVGNLYTQLEMKEVAVAAGNLGIELVAVEVRRVEDIVPALIAIRGQVQALYVPGDGLIFTHGVRVITVALAGRLPTIHNFREHVDAGGLMSYGPSFVALYRRSADYVDKILRGTKPSDIPVEQPTKFDLIINLVTAEGTRPRSAALAARPRRRGDRIEADARGSDHDETSPPKFSPSGRRRCRAAGGVAVRKGARS